jgi:hypothetical protein
MLERRRSAFNACILLNWGETSIVSILHACTCDFDAPAGLLLRVNRGLPRADQSETRSTHHVRMVEPSFSECAIFIPS